jgi:hypothetical protein
MNSGAIIPPNLSATPQRVEFFRLPAPGKRDPFFGLSRGWYYKAAAIGEIRMVAIRNRGAVRGVRLVAYDSVLDYIHRSMAESPPSGAILGGLQPIALQGS